MASYVLQKSLKVEVQTVHIVITNVRKLMLSSFWYELIRKISCLLFTLGFTILHIRKKRSLWASLKYFAKSSVGNIAVLVIALKYRKYFAAADFVIPINSSKTSNVIGGRSLNENSCFHRNWSIDALFRHRSCSTHFKAYTFIISIGKCF